MAKNKITHRWEDHGVLVFTGSLRQPTAVEINNYCCENGVRLEGLYVAPVKISGGWIPPEDLREVRCYPFTEDCPVCGKALNMGLDVCPICGKPWAEDEIEEPLYDDDPDDWSAQISDDETTDPDEYLRREV